MANDQCAATLRYTLHGTVKLPCATSFPQAERVETTLTAETNVLLRAKR